MNIIDLIALVRRSWILLVAGAVLGAIIGLIVALASMSHYTATTQVFVAGVASEGTNAVQAQQAVQADIGSYVEIVQSPAVLSAVARTSGRDLSTLGSEVSAQAPMSTSVVTISVTDTDPRKAAQIADATATQLVSTATKLSKPSANAPAGVRLTQLAPAEVPAKADGSTALHVAIGGVLGLVAGYVAAVVRLAARRSSTPAAVAAAD